MKIHRRQDVEFVPLPPAAITGDVEGQRAAERPYGDRLKFHLVSFSPGGRSRWHIHPFEQGLVITSGTGIVADENEEHVVTQGDVVIVPAGEKHWHGAGQSSAMAHLIVDAGEGETTILEPVVDIKGHEA